MAGSKEPDFVEKAPNTCPNLCGPINQHGRLWSKKMVNKGKEREQRGWEESMCKDVCWRWRGIRRERKRDLECNRKGRIFPSLILGCHLIKQSRTRVSGA